jgi:hypothetical protein
LEQQGRASSSDLWRVGDIDLKREPVARAQRQLPNAIPNNHIAVAANDLEV